MRQTLNRTDHTPPPEGITGWVVTVSDRCSAGIREDRSGPLAVDGLQALGVTVTRSACVPDEIEAIQTVLREGLEGRVDVILTTGGTGVTPRDQTPEATRPFITQPLDSLAHAIREEGAKKNLPTALLSRGLVGIAIDGDHRALIVNAPGSTGGVRDTLTVLTPILGHLIDQLGGGDHR